MSSAEAWLDLIAAALVPAAAATGPAVVVHEDHRWLPAVEQGLPTAWLQPHQSPWADFHAAAHRLPATRLRIGLDRRGGEALELLQRAALGVVVLPRRAESLEALQPFLAQLQPDAPWLVAGEAEAPAWRCVEDTSRQWQALPAPRGWRLLVGRPLAAAAQALQLDADYQLPLARRLLAALADRTPAGLSLQVTAQGHPRLQFRPVAVSCIATLAEPMLHHVLVKDRALFGARGEATVVLPWAGADRVRLLLRNVRSKVDDLHAACQGADLPPAAVHYTEHGALVDFVFPAGRPGGQAMLHLTLPAAALPPDDFCDIGAAEFSLELKP
ncbi:MAG TPA: hypothetical protein VLA61_00520 [Ideonella sp.]|uniref:hypothetical protein n=1 Tax=Ideonella sp. TaxID=1929293 RepID=UPI002BD9DC3C|nr:hypothetical protein [Ideonella sp.]HSI46733.1 hypothetical protein [Ideonella sp.]